MEKIKTTYINEKKLVWLSWVHLRTNTNFLQGNQWMHNSKGREKSMAARFCFLRNKLMVLLPMSLQGGVESKPENQLRDTWQLPYFQCNLESCRLSETCSPLPLTAIHLFPTSIYNSIPCSSQIQLSWRLVSNFHSRQQPAIYTMQQPFILPLMLQNQLLELWQDFLQQGYQLSTPLSFSIFLTIITWCTY